MEELKRYADIKIQIKNLTAEAKELSESVLEFTLENAIEKTFETYFGKFIITEKRATVWEDGDVKKAVAGKVKVFKEELEEEAIENGDAEIVINKTLMFKV